MGALTPKEKIPIQIHFSLPPTASQEFSKSANFYFMIFFGYFPCFSRVFSHFSNTSRTFRKNFWVVAQKFCAFFVVFHNLRRQAEKKLPPPKGRGSKICGFQPCCRSLAAVRVLAISMARVMGPTPPGTGVM
jgi:hypothetical protein